MISEILTTKIVRYLGIRSPSLVPLAMTDIGRINGIIDAGEVCNAGIHELSPDITCISNISVIGSDILEVLIPVIQASIFMGDLWVWTVAL